MQRKHIDFANFKQKNYFIIVDSYSNWLEVMPVDSTDFSSVEMALLKFFSVNGFCEYLISDGGPPFTSKSLSDVCAKCRINHILSLA
jgi:hypothetical protein